MLSGPLDCRAETYGPPEAMRDKISFSAEKTEEGMFGIAT
jgi:hypothetical protein